MSRWKTTVVSSALEPVKASIRLVCKPDSRICSAKNNFEEPFQEISKRDGCTCILAKQHLIVADSLTPEKEISAPEKTAGSNCQKEEDIWNIRGAMLQQSESFNTLHDTEGNPGI